jgi:CRISPR-associated endonuclease/helicase Cas3
MSDYDSFDFRLAGLALRQFPGDYPADGIDPYRHQWGLYDALSDGVSGAFVNAAPTGGGKTLSWVAPVVESGLDTIAVFPTNALIEDQRRNIVDDLLPKTGRSDEVTVLDVTSETLGSNGKYGAQFPEANSNGERLERLLRKHFGRQSAGTGILLTNPDTFVLMRRGLYNSRVANVKRFEVAVVDEFHRANRKEKNTMLFLLDEMYDLPEEVCRLKHLVFLSATPDARLERKFDEALSAPYYRADRFGWRSKPPGAVDVDAPAQVDYAPGELPGGHHAVLPPVKLTVNPAQTFRTAEEMLDDESFIDRVRGDRTVIMVDGIHEVDQLYDALLDAEVPGTVRIDGFNRQRIGEKLDDFGALVSNSAVEVGVNFDTDQIMFSGHSAASFFQRLGRLRTRSVESVAEGYTPPYTFPKLEEYHSEVGDEWVSRRAFEEQSEEIYVDASRAPESFDRRYSAVEAYDHAITRVTQAREDDKEQMMREAYARIARHFFPGETFSVDDADRLHATQQDGLLDSLKTYRGQSIQTLVYDTREQTIQTYNVPYLLRHGNVSFHPREAFLDHVPDELHPEVERLEGYSAGYSIYRGSAEGSERDGEHSGRLVTYKATGQLYSMLSNQPRDVRSPAAVTGLEIEVDGAIQGLSHLKDALGEQEVLCYALEGHANQIQNMYSLGAFGFIYPLLYSGGDAAIAFGHDALYLHCRVQDQIEKDSDAALDEVLDW